MHSFSLLVNSFTLEYITKALTNLRAVLCSPYITNQVKAAYKWLCGEINTIGQSAGSEESISELESDEESDVQEFSSTVTLSPFSEYFQNKLEKEALAIPTSGDINPLYAAEVFSIIIKKWVATCPFWSHLLQGW